MKNQKALNSNLEVNFILDTDSYKNSHGRMLPEDTTNLSVSIIPRKSNAFTSRVVALGQQYLVRRYLQVRITQEMIDEAEVEILEQGDEFDRGRWEYILRKHGGRLPLVVKAVPEGTVLPCGVPSVVIEATDKKCAWLPGYIEPQAQRVIWKMSTVASIARSIREHLEEVMYDMEGEREVPFHLHNFGSRGADAQEAAVMAGIAHLTQFSGTDELQANRYIKWLYNTTNAYGSSVIATEHSVMCANADAESRDDYRAAVMAVDLLEKAVVRFEQTSKGVPVVSVVIDTYNAYRFAQEFIGTRLKRRIQDLGARGGKLVLRPDSGDATTMPIEILEILMTEFGCTTNSKGFRNLPSYIGVIQGDGINQESLRKIIDNLYKAKISLKNIVFGMGSGLTHEAGRDEFSFAMKATARQTSSGEWIDMFKDPITDHKKKSLKGRCTTFISNDGMIFADRVSLLEFNPQIKDMMEEIFRDGEIIKEYTFDEVISRARA